jgi:CRP-like cAMP-binding protein
MPDVDEYRSAQMFPVLTGAQMARLAVHGARRSAAAGETMFEPGVSDPGIHVVLSGSLEVVRPDVAGDDIVTVLSTGQFTGEVSSLSGRRTLVRGRMRAAGEVLVLDGDSLRQVIQRDSDLSEVLMRTFILRRVALLARGFGDATLVGSRHSARTLRLQEFFTRNGHARALAPHPSAASPRDKPPAGLCRGGHSLGEREAGRICGRRGIHLRSACSSSAGYVRQASESGGQRSTWGTVRPNKMRRRGVIPGV